jgi:photosystem II stability/assembly factor-like uncharacterized protein
MGQTFQCLLPSEDFYRIRYQNSSIVHADTTAGYFRSTNNGVNWSQALSGNVSDIAINRNNTNTIYAGNWGDGVYKTTNNGINWSKVTTPGIPQPVPEELQ